MADHKYETMKIVFLTESCPLETRLKLSCTIFVDTEFSFYMAVKLLNMRSSTLLTSWYLEPLVELKL